MKKIAIFFLIVLIIFVGLMLGRNILAKALIGSAVKSISGVGVEIKGLDIGLFKTALSINGLKLVNPQGYQETLMMDMPQVYVDYDLGAILKGKIHLEHLILDLREFVVVKNAQGKVNIESLQALQPKNSGNAKMPELKIDLLELKIGKVIYLDYSQGRVQTREFKININEKYVNITDPLAFGSLIVTKALMNTTISSLTGIDLKPLIKSTGSLLKDGVGVVKGTVGVAEGVVKGVAGTVKNLFNVTQ